MKFSQSEFELTRDALEKCHREWSENQIARVWTQDERVQNALRRNECERAFYASFGWHEITNDEDWTRLQGQFDQKFYPGPEFCLPTPFITWNVDHVMDDYPTRLFSLQRDLHDKCIAALKRCDRNLAPWHVLENINHPWYQLEIEKMPDSIENWPVDLLPCDDPCCLVSCDMSCGIIIMDVGGPISIFGEPFFTLIADDMPLAFTQVEQKRL